MTRLTGLKLFFWAFWHALFDVCGAVIALGCLAMLSNIDAGDVRAAIFLTVRNEFYFTSIQYCVDLMGIRFSNKKYVLMSSTIFWGEEIYDSAF